MVGKKEIIPRTLESSIMKSGVSAISQLENFEHSKDIYFIVGGVAVQSYLPRDHYRPTADIDVCLARPLNNRTEFKEFAKPCIEYLQDHGFELSYKKASQNFKIIATDPKTDAFMFLEFVRRNERKYKQIEKRIERELEYSRKKTIGSHIIRVTAPEDVALPKIVRGTNSLIRNPEFKKTINSLYNSDLSLQELLHYSIKERANASAVDSDLISNEKSRLIADCYDITCLSRFTGFNEEYLTSSASQWDESLSKDEWKFLARSMNLPF